MKLFNTLMSKIFGHASAPVAAVSTATVASGTAASSSPTPADSGAVMPAGSSMPAATAAPAAVPAPVDVAAVLSGLAAKNSEHLDWKKSIVDLMKLVGMDSSLASRKELATELGYGGDQHDSATMNIWLHKEVLKQLAANGGNVPANLLD